MSLNLLIFPHGTNRNILIANNKIEPFFAAFSTNIKQRSAVFVNFGNSVMSGSSKDEDLRLQSGSPHSTPQRDPETGPNDAQAGREAEPEAGAGELRAAVP